jgi:hypothetical protein
METNLRPRRIGRLAIREFLRNRLKRKLLQDLRRGSIFCEADLQSCVYYHLRKFLRSDARWAVFNKAFISHLSVYPDIVLKRREVPRIAIELKEKRRLTRSWYARDLRKLHQLWRKGHKPIIGYMICLVRDSRPEIELQRLAEQAWRTQAQKKHLFPIIINAREHVGDWKKFRSRWQRHAKTTLRTK